MPMAWNLNELVAFRVPKWNTSVGKSESGAVSVWNFIVYINYFTCIPDRIPM